MPVASQSPSIAGVRRRPGHAGEVARVVAVLLVLEDDVGEQGEIGLDVARRHRERAAERGDEGVVVGRR